MMKQVFAKVVVLASLVVFAACSAPPGDEKLASSSEALTATGVDYSWARPSPSGLKAAGYTFAARYLSHDTTGKNLTHAEADALWAAGVDVVANWEDSSTAALNGFSQGASDATAADAQANADGIPSGRPIYFSVDFDATPGDETAINAYFDGVVSVIGLARAGAYGGYYVIQRLFDAGKIQWGWQTYAWSGGQWDARAQVRQVQNGITAAGDSDCCDEDQAIATDFGQWHAVPPNTPPRGYLDSAACAAVAGWAQDQDAPTTAIDVDVYFNGAAGAAGAEGVRIVAGNARSDLCSAIGSCNHGYSMPVPVGLLDGKSHSVYAYGIDSQGEANTLLTGSPKTVECPNATPPLTARAGVKRHVVDPASMTAWGFSSLDDVAPEPDSVVAAYPQSADWTEKPSLVQADDGTPQVWLIDGDVRRHVVSPDSLAAWHRTFAEVVKTPAAKVYAYAQGADLPATPFLMIGTGPAVWVVDVAPDAPPGSTTDDDAGLEDGGVRTTATYGDGGNYGADGASGGTGCSVRGGASSRGAGWGLAAFPLLIIAARRRRAKPTRR